MALGAGLREAALDVIGVGRLLEVGEMAADAVGRSPGVLAADVAGGALHGGVFAGERELGRRIVIKGRALPLGRRVALGAILRESGLHVVGRRRLLEVGEMAAHTISGRARVLASDVAGGAKHRRMFAGQGKSANSVIKLSALPARRCVAAVALHREAAAVMIGIGGAVEVAGMAASAVLRRARKTAADVAGRTLHTGMRASQGKARPGVVIKGCTLPAHGRVALRAILRESGLDVIGLLGCGEILRVAGKAIGCRAHELAADMATGALKSRMRADKGEARELRMVELRALPAIEAMTGLALHGQLCRLVIERTGIEVVLLMAGDAFRTQAAEDGRASPFVTALAGHGGVGSHQREPIQVGLNRLHSRLPSLDRVAVLASGAQLAAMEIRVTIGALLANIGEDLRDVARTAGDFLMHATQRKPSLRVVIEFRNGADGPPACCGVTVVAGYLDGSVRILCFASLGQCRQRTQRKQGGNFY